MPANCIHLTGYFDRNFGDDMMMKLVVRSLPEVTFLVADTADTPLWAEPNVVPEKWEVCRQFPKLVVIGSGFMINTGAALKAELRRFLTGYHPGDYCLGCNIEPLDSPVKRFLIHRKLNKFRLITCRDRASYDWIRRHTRKPEIHCLPDLLFSLPDQWLPAVRSPDKLGICMLHRVGDRADCAYYRAMAQTADEWIIKTGKGVILMALDTGKEDDLFACRAVRSLMQYPDRTEIAAHTDGTEIPAAYARCEKIIGARFHSMVLALRMGVPFYPLIFRDKVRNLMKDLQYPYPMCDLDDPDIPSLRDFLGSSPKIFPLAEGIHARAGEHAQLLKQRLTT